MADIPLAGRDSVDAQREMFRLAQNELGLSIPVIVKRSPLSLSTLKGWRDGAAMPAWALGALGAAGIPDHLLSLITEPFGKHIGTDELGDGDLDALGRESAAFVADKLEREGDGIVCHIDKAALKQRARRIAPIARRAAA